MKEAKEEHRLALDLQNIINFTSQCGFAVKQQFHPTHLLDKIGDNEDAAYYKTHMNAIKEYYLTLQKGALIYQHIEDVPTYQFAMPQAKVPARATP